MPEPSTSRLVDMTGQRFGKLIALRFNGRVNGHTTWLCRCDCGNETVADAGNLKAGRTRSCGCQRVKHGHNRKGRQSPESRSWDSMIQRCTNPAKDNYAAYGGSGITVCDRWRDFANFLSDMGPRPSLLHSIDRFPNPSGNYEPGNCRWATAQEQARNRSDNTVLTFQGESLCVTAWAERLGVKATTLFQRLSKGLSVEQTLTIPLGSISRWSKINE